MIAYHSAFGLFEVPMDVYVRAKRLDRRYPGNYPHGYLEAWCEFQWKKGAR